MSVWHSTENGRPIVSMHAEEWARITQQLHALSQPRESAGEKHVGTLPKIGDTIIGSGVTLYAADPTSGHIVEVRTRAPALVGTTSLGPLPEYHPWCDLHLTRESAESALSSPRQETGVKRGE